MLDADILFMRRTIDDFIRKKASGSSVNLSGLISQVYGFIQNESTTDAMEGDGGEIVTSSGDSMMASATLEEELKVYFVQTYLTLLLLNGESIVSAVDELQQLVSALNTDPVNSRPSFVVLEDDENLPSVGESGTFYYVPNGSTGDNIYDEYVWVEEKNNGEGGYENLGPRSIEITTDSTPTANSTNPVQSGGVKTYVDNKTAADSTPTANSNKLITSGGVKTYVDNLTSSPKIPVNPSSEPTVEGSIWITTS